MKPIEFTEQNVIYAENQDEYRNLPAFKEEQPHGRVVSCWQLSIWERIKILFTGKLWSCIMTFHKPIQPQFYTVHKNEVLNTEYFEELIFIDSPVTTQEPLEPKNPPPPNTSMVG